MTLEQYLEQLTDNNWHALRQLIEMERETLELEKVLETEAAYELAKDYLVAASWNRYKANN